MSLIKRVQLLERHFGTHEDLPPEALIIYTEDCSRVGAEPLPITKFSFNGQEIPRAPGESYADFETRALRAALEFVPPKQPGQAAPVPCLIGNGSLQE
ncbi:hypothetical protein [uncultured Desulfobacter sp.]|uniref:hypothetical protein n=1 Tax=uncultured Desulfobacter sp. TaxID=240139 RepID=UPI002AA62693|nr:hypothetical protein [uncultured Desulfobacter sp.]